MNDSTSRARQAAIYARVSSEEQATDGNSLNDQVARTEALIQSRGWAVQDTYVERGVTGTRASRPEWDRLMQAARNGQIDVVVVTKWNRFARSAQVGLTLANELEQLHVDLVVIEAEFDTSTSQGRLFRHMMVGLAEFDRDMVIENMTMGARRAAQDRAVWPCSMTPYGYKHSGSGTEAQLTVDAEQQRVIELATGWLVDDGLTTGQVCRRLDDLGMHPPRGGAWTHQNLRRKLTNRSLLGEHVWGRHPDDRHVDRGRHRPGKYGAPITVRSEPILSPERFAALQVALRRRSSGPKAAAQPYPLSGRLFCTCGEPYTGAHRADRNLRQYRCRGTRWTATDERTCRSRRLTADWVEDTVWTGVVALLTDPERLRACAADYLRSSAIAEQKDEGPGDTAALDATIARLDRALDRQIEASLLADDPTRAERIVAKLSEDLAAAKRRRTALQIDREGRTAALARVRNLDDLVSEAALRLPGMDREQRAQLLALLNLRVDVLDAPPAVLKRGGPGGAYGSWTPRLRVEGVLPDERLLPGARVSGDLGARRTPPAGPRRR